MIDDLLKAMNYQDVVCAQSSVAEVLAIALLSAKYFQNNHERTVFLLQHFGCTGKLSLSHFNRVLHRLQAYFMKSPPSWVKFSLRITCLSFIQVPYKLAIWSGVNAVENFKIKLIKAIAPPKRNATMAGNCTWDITLKDILSVSNLCLWYGMNSLLFMNLLTVLPIFSLAVADKGYISYKDEILFYLYTGVRLIPKYRKNMRENSIEDVRSIRAHHSMIETVNSQLEKMDLHWHHARTNGGVTLKVVASLVALSFTNR